MDSDLRDDEALERIRDVVDREYRHDPGPGFEARVWQRLEPALTPRTVSPVQTWRWMAAAAVLVLAAFVAGRFSAGPVAPAPALEEPSAARVLLIDLGGHLDMAEMTLVEFDAAPVVDELVRARTEDLIAANRLYRGTAMTTGDDAVARVLDELERALIEIATAPPDAAAAELEELRQRINTGGLLLKLQVMRDVLQDRAPGAQAAGEAVL